jgi:aminoglycoside phosphotransferase (APT) family kinase protein
MAVNMVSIVEQTNSQLSQFEFDPARLDQYLRSIIPGLGGPMELERIAGGQSNPTFFVSYANRRMVLRKQPAGPVLPSAHAVDREYRIMDALAGSSVPVPKMLAFCASREVVGTPFYVMERLEGRVFPDAFLPGVSPSDRREMYFSMAETMAKLHQVNWQQVGLADYGKTGNYFERQIGRWTKQWHLSKTRDIPAIDRLIEWLPRNMPSDDTTTISHGDFRIGNLMFHPTEPRVVGVLDWELSTLGHPLADAAYSALAWRLPPTDYMGMAGMDLKALGIPSEEEYLARYYANAPSFGRVTEFHVAFSMFRLAVIMEGITARAKNGNANDQNAAVVGELAIVLANRAVELIDEAAH